MNEPQQGVMEDGATPHVRWQDNESHSDPTEVAAGTDVERFSVVVIGGGQAGLAAGYHLAQRGIDFVILEKASRLGESWRRRWDRFPCSPQRATTACLGCPSPASSEHTPRKTRWRTICRSTQNDLACRSDSGSMFLA
jgi:cation diffusion facilitator CzcD-associated flavoprotein CzcO